MMTLTVCPSTLAEGFDTYSLAARKKMFDDKAVSHYLRVPSPSTNSEEANEAIRNAKRISLYSPSIRSLLMNKNRIFVIHRKASREHIY